MQSFEFTRFQKRNARFYEQTTFKDIKVYIFKLSATRASYDYFYAKLQKFMDRSISRLFFNFVEKR